MRVSSSILLVSILFILSSVFVSAEDYVIGQDTGDINLYLDYRAVPMDAKTYGTVSITGHEAIEMHCITMVFWNNSGTYVHVQSNPEPTSSSLINLRLAKTTPEDNGYFTATDGQGAVYFTKKGIRAYDSFLFVAKCVDEHGQHIAEEVVTPAYREFAPNAANRVVWFNQNSNTIILFLAVLFLVVLFIYARMSR
jgi:hypothetical protein